MDQTIDAIPTYGSYACASFAFMFDEVYDLRQERR